MASVNRIYNLGKLFKCTINNGFIVSNSNRNYTNLATSKFKHLNKFYSEQLKTLQIGQFRCFSRSTIFFCRDFNKNENSSSKKGGLGLADELLSSKLKIENPEETSKPKEAEEAEEKEDRERAWRAMKFSFIFFGVWMFGSGAMMLYAWGSPQTDENGKEIIDEFSGMPLIKQYLYRTWRECNNMNKMIQEPAREQLLPDPLKEPYIQPPYTLVLELKDILVHPEWTYETGWRFKKRPGVDFLLQHCAPPLFEIVIYTNEQGFTAFPLLDHLDPNGFIWYRLFKDSTRYVDGKHLKDLSCLNRDLSKVIMLDWDSDAISNVRNHLKLERWDGKMDDKTLIDLGIMLRTIAESEVSDVREVLDYYRSFDDPIEAFKKNQRAAQEQELILKQQVEKEGPPVGVTGSWTSSFLRRR